MFCLTSNALFIVFQSFQIFHKPNNFKNVDTYNCAQDL